MVEYHMMNNRRFVLTRNEDNLVELWQLDTLQKVSEFKGQRFDQVKEQLRQVDMKHSPENPLPQSWMSLHIKLGVSTRI